MSDQPTTFLSLVEIKLRYKVAKRRFYTKKRLLQICRDHCRYGGKWPTMTRDAKLALHKAAIKTRHLQQLKNHLEAKAAAVVLD